MKTLASDKSKQTGILCGVLALIVVVTIAPHAFAITYTNANNPHGPMEPIGWIAGLAIAGVLSGFGGWMAVKRGKLH